MNNTPFPTLSTATIDAINVIGQWLAQDDFSGEVPYQADCVILAGNAVMPTIDAACKIARDQQIPLLISGGIGHSTTFLYSAIAQHPHYNTIRTTGRAEATIWRISLISSGIFRMKKSGLKTSQQTAVKTHALASRY